ncbi:S-layer protein [Thermococcus aggregans]|uniref:S-layer protein n=1 Tax=Thermococcus aggregans TaxID=110163 RepID=A0A9E7MVX8_THEAG|nr:S-layer protein [Thermococcus aggregans]USS39844.1 S-layer protein [Thermococcus aggregans]
MKRTLSFVVVLLVFFSIGGIANAYSFSIDSTNAVIVLPTTKVVNDQPLHINEDAIAGARLGAFLVLKGIRPSVYSTYVNVPVTYRSVIIPDNDQYYKLSETDMPDVGLTLGETPEGNKIVIAVNFSRVSYNSTSKKAQFGDRSVEIIFNENTTPLSLGGENTKLVSTVKDGKDILYIYSYEEKSDSKSLGSSVIVNGWKLYFHDIDTEQKKTLVEITYPSGIEKTQTLYRGKYYIMYVDSGGLEDFEVYDTYPSGRIETLLKEGAKKVLVFTPSDFFIGIGGTKQVTYEYEYYEKTKTYQDGDVYKGQWVWDIDPSNYIFTLYPHVDPDNDFPVVTLGEGDVLDLPIFELSISPVFEKDDNGDITGIEGYRFLRTVTVKKKVTVETTKANVVSDVNSLIITDEELSNLPTDKHVIIIGGWVSNKAWKILEQNYDSATIESLKNEIMNKGYVVAILDNPLNTAFKVIILAGKDYIHTKKAVDEFMSKA